MFVVVVVKFLFFSLAGIRGRERDFCLLFCFVFSTKLGVPGDIINRTLTDRTTDIIERGVREREREKKRV